MIPKSIIRDENAIKTNKIINPEIGFLDLTNLKRNTGASQAAKETDHLPLENINKVIPAISRI